MQVSALLLPHAQQLDVFLLQLVVDFVFFAVGLLARSFFDQLLVELLTHEPLALLLPQLSLLLFLVVQKLVEFLNCGPLVLLCDLRINFGERGPRRRD